MTKIALFAFEGISLFHLSVPIAIFKDAFAFDKSPFEVEICAEKPGQVNAENGIEVTIERGLKALEEADILIFPSWVPAQKPSEALIELLIRANDDGKTIVGLCLGAFVLGYAGLLDNRKATTHWAFGDDFQRKFPRVSYLADPLFIREENLITSAGTAAAIDCCLNMLHETKGSTISNQVARMMVSAPQRAGGQKQFISRPVVASGVDDRIRQFTEAVLNNLRGEYSLSYAAEQCAMSPRSFSRHFQKSFSMSFIEWLSHIRLSYSQELLESTSISITEIADKAGFSSEQNYRKLFKQAYSVTPSNWRKSFNNNS